MRARSDRELQFRQACDTAGLASGRVMEFKFHPTRRWLLDFAWPERKVAVEVDGVSWSKKARHQTASGMQKDHEKFAHALMLGWKVLRVVPNQVKSGDAIDWLRQLMHKE